MRRLAVPVATALLGLAVTACTSSSHPAANTAKPNANKSVDPHSLRFVNVVKITGIGWFNRMQTGIEKFREDTGVNASQTGPAQASAEDQVKIIQGLIAQKPTVLSVVPDDPAAVEGVLKQAMNAGIIVVTHEAASEKNTNVDIEAFDNKAYGAHIMDNLAQCMGGSGQYAAFVGSVTAESHMQWVEGALDEAKAKYPGITRVTGPLESNEDPNVAYQKTKELLTKYPHLKGIEGSASVDVAGIGKAVRELGLQNRVCVMGTSIPSVAGDYLQDGSVDKIFFWDPAIAGHAIDKLGLLLAQGQKITPGLNLGLPGYESLQQDTTNPLMFHGSAWIDVDKTNMAEYPF